MPVLETTDVPPDWEQPIAADASIWPETDWWTGFSSRELNDIVLAVERVEFDLDGDSSQIPRIRVRDPSDGPAAERVDEREQVTLCI